MQKNNKRKNNDEFEDDGRVIANMDGVSNPYKLIPTLPDRPNRFRKNKNNNVEADLTKEEERQIRRGMLAASLLVGVVIGIVFLIFILFCVLIWFK